MIINEEIVRTTDYILESSSDFFLSSAPITSCEYERAKKYFDLDYSNIEARQIDLADEEF